MVVPFVVIAAAAAGGSLGGIGGYALGGLVFESGWAIAACAGVGIGVGGVAGGLAGFDNVSYASHTLTVSFASQQLRLADKQFCSLRCGLA